MTEIRNPKPVLVIEYWYLRFICNLEFKEHLNIQAFEKNLWKVIFCGRLH
jgi:hypothetical protein